MLWRRPVSVGHPSVRLQLDVCDRALLFLHVHQRVQVFRVQHHTRRHVPTNSRSVDTTDINTSGGTVSVTGSSLIQV